MNSLRITTQALLTATLAIAATACPTCCTDWDYEFCESCADQNKVPYECNYSVEQLSIDATGLAYLTTRLFRLTGCWNSVAEAEFACQAACDGFHECNYINVQEFYCDGVDDCATDGGDATAGNAAGPDCSGWAPSSEVQVDPASGVHVIAWDFWFGMLSEPQRVSCDATSVMPSPAGPGFMVDNVLSGSLADALGLQSGDVLVSLDGQALSDLDDVRDAAVSLANALSFQLAVERRGYTIVLDYSVQ